MDTTTDCAFFRDPGTRKTVIFPVFWSIDARSPPDDKLYGAGAVTFDWKALAQAASAIRMTGTDLHWEQVERRSTRTGQVHPIGGFSGVVKHEGALGPFMPLLRAGQWKGLGAEQCGAKVLTKSRKQM